MKAEEERKTELKELEHQLAGFVEKTNGFEKQDNDINCITADLTKGIENLVSILQTIARQRPTTPFKAQQHVVVDGEENPPLETAQTASSQKRSEKLRQMIDFSLPKETLGQSGVTESNLVQFLGLIEQKCNELLTLNYIINSPKKITQLVEGSDGLMPCGGVAGLLGQGPTAPVGNITIVAPSTGYSDLI